MDTAANGLRQLLDRPSEPAPEPATAPPDPGRPPRRGRTLLRLLLVLLVIVALLVTAGVGAALYLQHRYDANIERFDDPFTSIPATERPPAAAGGAMNVLLLGSDSRISAGDPADWQAGAQRTDAIMVAHISGDRSKVGITSIPRDSWVDVPGHGMNKINAAFSFGGPSLMVRTVEKVTGVRIDHVVIADFDGFQAVTDALGGVEIDVPRATKDERGSFAAGTQLMDGATALRYVRQRHNLPGGDFDRVKRQQNWIRAVLSKTISAGSLSDLGTMNTVIGDLTSSLAVDRGFRIGDMRSLAWSLRKVRSDDITFMTAPVAGTGWSPDGKQAIVRLDRAANATLWKAVRADRLQSWLQAHPAAALGATVR